MKLPLRQTVLMTPLLLAACQDGGASLRFSVKESDTRTANAQVQALTEPIPPGPSFQASDGTHLMLTEARIHLRDIRLDLPQGTKCADVKNLLVGATCGEGEHEETESEDGGTHGGSGTVEIPGPLVVDLLNNTTTPDLSGLRLPAGTYRRIDFRLEEGRSDELPANDALIGASFIARAQFTDDGSPASTLELRFAFSEDARFESATGVTVEADDTLVALLKPQVWLEGLPVGQCLKAGDLTVTNGVARIDDSARGSCSDAENRVKENIKRSNDLRKGL
jgi:hypothetical protein